MSDSPALEADGARIDVLGRPLLSELSVSSRAARVALLGDWSPLFRLLSGDAELAAGRLEIAGERADRAVASGRVGLQRLDPELPAAWSAERFLLASAELAGYAPSAAREAARAVQHQLGLEPLATRRLAHLQVFERRGLLIGHALLTEPAALCLEQPLAGLDTHSEQVVLATIERAATGRMLLVALANPEASAAERELLSRAGDVLHLVGGALLRDDPASPRKPRVLVTVCSNHAAFLAALAARGLEAAPGQDMALLGALTSSHVGPPVRYAVTIGERSTAAVLDAALESNAALVELMPAD